MELDGNNGINFYKQVAPTGLFWDVQNIKDSHRKNPIAA